MSLVFTTLIFAQSPEALKKDSEAFYQATTNINVPEIYKYTYPKLFETLTLDQLKTMYASMTSNENFVMKFEKSPTERVIGEIKTFVKSSYAKIRQENVILMTFKYPVEDPKTMIAEFKNTMQAKEVTFNKKSNTFRIVQNTIIIAIANEKTNYNWRFINFSNKKNVIKDLFGAEVSKALELE